MSRWPLPSDKVKPQREIHALTHRLVLRAGSMAVAFIHDFLICVQNILGLYFPAPIVKCKMEGYLAQIESGAIKR